MNEDVKNEAVEICSTACEKYAQNYELAAKQGDIKHIISSLRILFFTHVLFSNSKGSYG